MPEEALPEVQRLRDPRMSEHILTRKHQAHQHHTHPHAASGWHIHCSVEVTKLSTNKQHTLSGQDFTFGEGREEEVERALEFSL